jgi:hypothetical protein
MCAELVNLSESQEVSCGINMLGSENIAGLFSLKVVGVVDQSHHWSVQLCPQGCPVAPGEAHSIRTESRVASPLTCSGWMRSNQG